MTTILEAAENQSIEYAAYAFLEAGCSILPIRGKQPAVFHWEDLTERPPRVKNVDWWLRSKKLVNAFGVICGPISGNLVVIDVDNMAACAEFEAAFPSLADTLTIRSGSGHGRHYYLYADTLPENAWREGVELRARNAYVVAPPSRHPSGNRYVVERHLNVRRVSALGDVRTWLIARGERIHPTKPTARPVNYAPKLSSDASAYGRAALRAECKKVEFAQEGEANNVLYRAALKMGSLIAANKIGQAEVEIELTASAAGLSARDGVQATCRTIASGLRTGMGNPRKVS